MSLNAEAISDLDDTVIDNDIIDPPVNINRNQQPVTFIVDDSIKTNEDTEIKDSILKSDIQFKLVNDNIEKIIDLETVESELLTEGTISKESAAYINEVANIFNDRLTLESFSELPTQINFNNVVKNIKNKVEENKENAVGCFCTFMKAMVEDTKPALMKILDIYLPETENHVKKVSETSLSFIKLTVEDRNAVLPFRTEDKTDFINISTQDLSLLDFTKVDKDDLNGELLQKQIEAIKTVINGNSFMKYFIIKISEDQEFTTTPSASDIYEASNQPITLMTLCKFFNSRKFKEYLETTDGLIRELVSLIEQFTEDTTVDEYSKLKTIISNRSEDINNIITNSLFIYESLYVVNILALHSKVIYENLKNI